MQRKRKVPFWRIFAFRTFLVGLPDLAFSSVFVWLKLTAPERNVIGTDCLVTFMFVGAISSKLLENIALGYEELGQFRGFTRSDDLFNAYWQISTQQLATQFILHSLTISMLWLDRSVGATGNGQNWIIIIRAVLGILQTGLMGRARRVLMCEVQHVIAIVRHTTMQHKTYMSTVMSSLEKQNRTQSQLMIYFGIVNALTMLPPMWKYSFYVFMVVTTWWRVLAHPVRLLERIKADNKLASKCERNPFRKDRFQSVRGTISSCTDEKEDMECAQLLTEARTGLFAATRNCDNTPSSSNDSAASTGPRRTFYGTDQSSTG